MERGRRRGMCCPIFRIRRPRGTVVVLHGNGEYAWDHAQTARSLRQRGFRTFLYEYPGYGGRTGVPSEKAIVPEVQAVVRALDGAGLGPVLFMGAIARFGCGGGGVRGWLAAGARAAADHAV